MAKRKGMTEGQLAALCQSEIDDAIGYDESDISVRRAKALDYYNGEVPDVPAEEGRSSVTSHDVSDTIGWILPGLMRLFMGADNVAEFEPEGPEDEAFAQQATDYINYVFERDCEGYRVLYNACFEGLLFGNGIVKHWWDTKTEYEVQDFSNLSDDAYTMLVEDDDVEVLQHSEIIELDEQTDPMSGTIVEIPTTFHDVKIRRAKYRGCVKVKSLPPEEFLIERYATSIQDAKFLCHRRSVTRGDLLAEGFDRSDVMNIGSDDALESTDEHLNRWDDLTTGNQRRDSDDPLMQEVEVFECYVKTDFDGDDYPEWRKVVMAGSGNEKSILSNDEWGDDVPFTDLVPEPRPHRWDGRSIFDEMQDVQRIKTALQRQTLDNLYLTNHPQREAVESEVINMDELMTPTLGGVVLTKRPNAVRDMAVPFVAQNSFAMLEYLDSVGERRTGVSQRARGMDSDALQNQSATAAQLASDAAHSKQELYARNIAELGLKRLFKCLLKIVVKHQDQPRTIRLRNQWVEMDPRSWNSNMDVVVNVGLGTGSRERDMQMLMMIGMEQDKIVANLGPANPIVTPEMYVNTKQKMVAAAGLKGPDQYFADVNPDDMKAFMDEKASQPNPEMQKVQAEAQAEQAKMQMQGQMDAQKAQQDFQLATAKLQQEAQMKREQMLAEMDLKRWQIGQELALKREQIAAEMQIKRELGMMGIGAQAMSSDVNVGGDPG